MNLTPDEILSQARSEADALDSLAALTLATQLQLAAAVLFVRVFDAASATTEASPPSRKPEADRLISILEGARRINKHRSWMDRHGRTLGIVVCDPTSGRALGCSEHAINRFLGVDPAVALVGRRA